MSWWHSWNKWTTLDVSGVLHVRGLYKKRRGQEAQSMDAREGNDGVHIYFDGMRNKIKNDVFNMILLENKINVTKLNNAW